MRLHLAVLDHLDQNTILLYQNEDNLINTIKNHLENNSFNKYEPSNYSIETKCESNLNYDEYEKRFNKIQSYIKNGD